MFGLNYFLYHYMSINNVRDFVFLDIIYKIYLFINFFYNNGTIYFNIYLNM